MNTPTTPAEGDILHLQPHTLTTGGRALARHGRLAVFIDNALPGQTVTARVTRCRKNYAEATLLGVTAAADYQTEPFCRHFAECGGCSWQHMPYAMQLEWKQRLVHDAFVRIGRIAEPPVLPALASPAQRFFRNKMEFAFENDSPQGIRLGLRARGSHDVINISECHLQSQRCVRIVDAVRRWAAQTGLTAWDVRSGEGFFRYLVIRETLYTGQCMVQLITGPEKTGGNAGARAVRQLGDLLAESGEGITSFIHGERRSPVQAAYAEKTLYSTGDSHLTEQLNGRTFTMAPHAFFQTNTAATEILSRTAADYAGQGGVLWDLYCGVGTMGLGMADQVTSVTGMEVSEEAVQFATLNARNQQVPQARFLAGDVRRLLIRHKEKPDIVITDPPRAGMHPDVLSALISRAPRKIVYISCDPATQARDAAALTDSYRLEAVQPVDMFPHSAHIESVALFSIR
jgi:23S rRNA (uracil1939-C5)-methyltransferase